MSQERVAKVCLPVWDIIENKEDCKFEHPDDFILAAYTMVKGVDEDVALVDNLLLVEWDDRLQLTDTSELRYYRSKWAQKVVAVFSYCQWHGDEDVTVLVLDMLESQDADD